MKKRISAGLALVLLLCVLCSCAKNLAPGSMAQQESRPASSTVSAAFGTASKAESEPEKTDALEFTKNFWRIPPHTQDW